MMELLTIIESTTLFVLAGIHFNWAIGGTWGFDVAIPTKENGERLMNPGKIDSATVGFGLASFGLYYLILIGWIEWEIPFWALNYAKWVIAGIFTLRSIGDFRYLGFFKKLKTTEFAKKDTKIYAPLCLGLGVIGFLLATL